MLTPEYDILMLCPTYDASIWTIGSDCAIGELETRNENT